ncbi:MAG TPA: hypothetical protein DCE49_02895 [Pseudomonas sp.]|nr:hypothetical protein [Pseudomonas sp.]
MEQERLAKEAAEAEAKEKATTETQAPAELASPEIVVSEPATDATNQQPASTANGNAEPSIARKPETPPAEPEAEQAVTELLQPEVEAVKPATEADADVQEEVDPQGLDKRQD